MAGFFMPKWGCFTFQMMDKSCEQVHQGCFLSFGELPGVGSLAAFLILAHGQGRFWLLWSCIPHGNRPSQKRVRVAPLLLLETSKVEAGQSLTSCAVPRRAQRANLLASAAQKGGGTYGSEATADVQRLYGR
jgi:hypothetical protein